MQECSFSEILKTSTRVSFEENHRNLLFTSIKRQYAKGLVVRFHANFSPTLDDIIAKMDDGIFVLSCPQIESDYVFVCEAAGIGIFGRQKRAFRVFTGSFDNDDFHPGITFKNFTLAVTSVNNIFRAAGLLQGSV